MDLRLEMKLRLSVKINIFPFSVVFVFQNIDTIGGYDFEYFRINNNHYLAAANSYDGVKTKLHSVIYQWILSNFVPLQFVEVKSN